MKSARSAIGSDRLTPSWLDWRIPHIEARSSGPPHLRCVHRIPACARNSIIGNRPECALPNPASFVRWRPSSIQSMLPENPRQQTLGYPIQMECPVKLCLSPALVTLRPLRQMLSLALVLTAIPLFAQQSPAPAQPPAGKPVAKPAIKAYVLAPTPPPTHKMGPLQININWRERTEDWHWFQGNT